MEPSAFSGPRLAPPISDTAETATIAGHRARVDVFVLQVGDQAGSLVGQVGQPAEQADQRHPAAAVTAIHHHCPPNQPGS